MKIFNETDEPKRCLYCGGDDFKPAADNRFGSRTCGLETTGKIRPNDNEK
ncbi:MAG TPA: hypothetical protein VF648_00440 [Pyrinomonadaceae bacterium]|jgi:hypothetical protein